MLVQVKHFKGVKLHMKLKKANVLSTMSNIDMSIDHLVYKVQVSNIKFHVEPNFWKALVHFARILDKLVNCL